MADETTLPPPVVEQPKPRTFDFIPELVGGAAGLAKGLLSSYGTGLGTYRDGIFRGLLLASGGAGYLFRWDPDVTYTLLAVGTYDLMAQVAPAIQAKSIKVLAGDVAQPTTRITSPTRPTLHSAAGCTSCASTAPRAAALLAPALADTSSAVL